MKLPAQNFQLLASVSDFARTFGLEAPSHPLLGVFSLDGYRPPARVAAGPYLRQLYLVTLKRNLKGNLRYGYGSYDFSEGVLGFYAPGQPCANEYPDSAAEVTGWMVAFHPDLLAPYPLGQKINRYNFFSYQVNEALHLSGPEEAQLTELVAGLRRESVHPIDDFSQEVLVAQLDLLLTLANRFYYRQFRTRQVPSHDLLTRFEAELTAYFAHGDSRPLPTVHYFAEALHVSPAYLSDLLRSYTGLSTQQHIHQALIDRAKHLLQGTSLSINETAFRLGFEYPQYFSRLFKNKTGLTPAEFRFLAHQPLKASA